MDSLQSLKQFVESERKKLEMKTGFFQMDGLSKEQIKEIVTGLSLFQTVSRGLTALVFLQENAYYLKRAFAEEMNQLERNTDPYLYIGLQKRLNGAFIAEQVSEFLPEYLYIVGSLEEMDLKIIKTLVGSVCVWYFKIGKI